LDYETLGALVSISTSLKMHFFKSAICFAAFFGLANVHAKDIICGPYHPNGYCGRVTTVRNDDIYKPFSWEGELNYFSPTCILEHRLSTNYCVFFLRLVISHSSRALTRPHLQTLQGWQIGLVLYTQVEVQLSGGLQLPTTLFMVLITQELMMFGLMIDTLDQAKLHTIRQHAQK
jgi:hypothetical protein